jgi:hypothetical protein
MSVGEWGEGSVKKFKTNSKYGEWGRDMRE